MTQVGVVLGTISTELSLAVAMEGLEFCARASCANVTADRLASDDDRRCRL